MTEKLYPQLTRGQNVVVKSPEYASREEMDYIASLYQEWEDAIYNGGVNPVTGKKYTEYVDLRSAAVCYLANEISKNQDGFRTSSFFYKDNDDDMMYMGPLWDYDITLNFNGKMWRYDKKIPIRMAAFGGMPNGRNRVQKQGSVQIKNHVTDGGPGGRIE